MEQEILYFFFKKNWKYYTCSLARSGFWILATQVVYFRQGLEQHYADGLSRGYTLWPISSTWEADDGPVSPVSFLPYFTGRLETSGAGRQAEFTRLLGRCEWACSSSRGYLHLRAGGRFRLGKNLLYLPQLLRKFDFHP